MHQIDVAIEVGRCDKRQVELLRKANEEAVSLLIMGTGGSSMFGLRWVAFALPSVFSLLEASSVCENFRVSLGFSRCRCVYRSVLFFAVRSFRLFEVQHPVCKLGSTFWAVLIWCISDLLTRNKGLGSPILH